MFHEGDIQSGISFALQNGRSVVCFVSDSSSASQLWEQEWLREEDVTRILSESAVVLRIEKNSQEAQQLSAIYPVSEAPALLIMNQGKLVTKLLGHVTKDEFIQSILSSFKPDQQHISNQVDEVGSTVNDQDSSPHNVATPSDPPPVPGSSPQPSAPPNRDARPKSPATPSGSQPSSSNSLKNVQQETYVQRQARQKREALEERQRVRALIEADKRERKSREERRREVSKKEAEQARKETSNVPSISTSIKSDDEGTVYRGCSIQCRLLDGSTLRYRFKASDTLKADVREWVDQNRTDDGTPYTFKLVLTPSPSRALDDADESKTLTEAGLVPSSCLALVPVENVSEAYRTRGSMALVKGAPILIYGYITSLLAFLYTLFQRITGLRRSDTTKHSQTKQSSPQEGTSNPRKDESGDASSQRRNIRITTLRDQQDGSQDDRQLYNGNTLNFESRENDDSKE